MDKKSEEKEIIRRFSRSSLTGKTYEIPVDMEDKSTIDRFIQSNSGKPIVVIQGLGFVGSVMALVCANAVAGDYAVIGVDLPNEENFWKIKSFNEGIFPLIAEDPKIEQYYRAARKRKCLYATFDEYAYSRADVIIVDINLDVYKNNTALKELSGYDVNLTNFKSAIRSIGKNCKEDVLILVETTVPPGTCEKVVKPIIRECLKNRGLSETSFKLSHSYERVMPGPNYINSIQSFYRVYSGIDTESADAAETFLKTIIRTDEYPITRLCNTNATEMAKVLENSYRAMNIAFIVEWSRFAEEAGVNLFEVVNAIRMRPTHSNMMFPGIGVGGYCLTKDPLLASWARQNLFEIEEPLFQSEIAVKINDKMPQYAFEFLRDRFDGDLTDTCVLLLGVSYRGDVGDTRYTPVELFYDCLVDAGSEVLLHDPYISYWKERTREVTSDIRAQIVRKPRIIVITTGHSVYKDGNTIQTLLDFERALVYDTIGLFDEQQLTQLRRKHSVKVLGRGDL